MARQARGPSAAVRHARGPSAAELLGLGDLYQNFLKILRG